MFCNPTRPGCGSASLGAASRQSSPLSALKAKSPDWLTRAGAGAGKTYLGVGFWLAKRGEGGFNHGSRSLNGMKTSNISKFALLLGRLGKMCFVNPRGLQEVGGVALAMTENLIDPEIDVLPIPRVNAIDLLPPGERNVWSINVRPFPRVTFSVTLEEAVGLAMLMRKCNAKRAFEFGTHRGVSSTQLTANLPEDGQLFTLDLPRSDTSTHFKVEDWAEKEVANYPVKGDLLPAELRSKVTFLEKDSALFDPKPYAGSMDFVFVDAAHTLDYVKNDSEKAWVMLRPGGIVAWHDCRAQSPDVVRYLRACPFQPKYIFGTTLAFAEKPLK